MRDGGTGDDTFVFGPLDGGHLVHTIGAINHFLGNAFVTDHDMTHLSAIDAYATLPGDQAFTFMGQARITGVGQANVAFMSNGVYLRLNPEGTTSPEILIHLKGTPISLIAANEFIP